MSTKLKLTLACGGCEIVRSLRDGSITPDGIALNVLTDMDSSSRHWRMIRNEEFDVCELSGSSDLMAKDRGQGFSAIPIYMHTRFGLKGLREGGAIAPPAAIGNAMRDAFADVGAEFNETPFTTRRILETIEKSR